MHKYYKDDSDNVYAYEADGSQDEYIKPGLTSITEEEMLELTKQPYEAPAQCTPGQGLVALFALKGITEADLLAQIDAISDPVQRYTAQIAYSRAISWDKTSQTVKLLVQALGLTPVELDELFAYAVTVQL